jgi:nucleoside phosphorylase
VEGCPRLHLGPIASGRLVSRDETCRQQFAALTGALAFDPQLDAAVQSVRGNCRDAFIAIRGISDYRDGSRRSEWQPYAALAAAAVMKAIVLAMEPPSPH